MQRSANARREPAWKVGDMVLLESEGTITRVPRSKLAPYFMGLLKVLEVLPGGTTYRLDVPPTRSRVHNGFSEQVLRPFVGVLDVPAPVGAAPAQLGGQSPCIGLPDEP